MKILRDRRGEFALDGAFRLLLAVAILLVCLSCFGVAFQANKLHTMAGSIARYVSLQGEVNASVEAELERLSDAAALEDVSLEIDVDDGHIQFGDRFTVELAYTGAIGLGGVFSLPIPMTASVVGRSEVFWK